MIDERNINFKEKRFIIADVDETICESCQEVSLDMASEIHRLIDKGYQFAFVSGTKVSSLTRMISSRLKKQHHLLGNSGTNCVLMKDDGSSTTVYNYPLSEKEKKDIFLAFDQLIKHFNIKSMTTKEDQVQDRDSQITISAIGRHAPIELKAQYDPNGEKRQVWIKFLRNYLPKEKYGIRIGGTTSVDVTKAGLDKEWGIRQFAKQNNIKHEEIIFFGDKLYPGGNDYSATKVVDCIAVKNPLDTLTKFKQFFP